MKNRKVRLSTKPSLILSQKNKRIAISLGDPLGIGPEIIKKCSLLYQPQFPVAIIGNSRFFAKEQIPEIQNIQLANQPGFYFLPVDDPAISPDPSFAFVKYGVQLALNHQIHALVTAPITKTDWAQAGAPHAGHTEFLAESTESKKVSMFFWSPSLKVSLFTIHIPLKQIFRFIKKSRIIAHIRQLHAELQRLFHHPFNFLISGLNPHAGENGLLGREEIQEIIPAIRVLENEMSIQGPFPPDIIFRLAQSNPNQVVLSWYHDQGLIPFKLLHFHNGVNLTLGLPFIRTSPDHGSARDIAGKDSANPQSLIQALRLAEDLVALMLPPFDFPSL